MKAQMKTISEALDRKKVYPVWGVDAGDIVDIMEMLDEGRYDPEDVYAVITDEDVKNLADETQDTINECDEFAEKLSDVHYRLAQRIKERLGLSQDLADEIKSTSPEVSEGVVKSTNMKTNESVPAFVSLDEQLPDPFLMEANSDGTRSEGEEEAANELIDGITNDVKVKIRKAAIKLHRLGGPFRSGAYLQKLMQGVNQAVTDAVKDEAVDVEKEAKGKKAPKDAKKAPKKDAGEGVDDDMEDDR